MHREQVAAKKYEEWALVLDFKSRGRSSTMRGREGTIVTAIGESMMTLLEILGAEGSTVEIGERAYSGKEGRKKVQSVLGKIKYGKLSHSAKNELPLVVERIIADNEKRFTDYINMAQPLTPRIHSLELIPGVGKAYLQIMLEERDKKKFDGFGDLYERVGFKEPARRIAQRIIDEIAGETRVNLFVKR